MTKLARWACLFVAALAAESSPGDAQALQSFCGAVIVISAAADEIKVMNPAIACKAGGDALWVIVNGDTQKLHRVRVGDFKRKSDAVPGQLFVNAPAVIAVPAGGLRRMPAKFKPRGSWTEKGQCTGNVPACFDTPYKYTAYLVDVSGVEDDPDVEVTDPGSLVPPRGQQPPKPPAKQKP